LREREKNAKSQEDEEQSPREVRGSGWLNAGRDEFMEENTTRVALMKRNKQ